jgi:PAS domain S-box-containing protein
MTTISSTGSSIVTGSTSTTVLFVTAKSEGTGEVREVLENYSLLSVKSATTGQDALDQLTDNEADINCIVTSYTLPDSDIDGISLLEAVQSRSPEIPVIVYGSPDNGASPGPAERALQAGAADYLHVETGNDRTTDLAKRIEHSIRLVQHTQQSQTFHQAIEHAGHSIYITDTDGIIQYVNPAFEEITGYSEDEAIGKNPRILQSGEYDDAFYEDLWETILSGSVWNCEMVNERKNGDRYIVNQTIAPITNQNGEITYFIAVNDDITDQREVEQELQETTQYLESIIEASPNPIIAIDTDGVVDVWNPAAEQLFGYTEKEVVGESLLSTSVIPDDKQDEFNDRINQVLEGNSFTGAENKRQTKDGEWVDLFGATAPIRDADGEVTGVMVVLQDITERKERERELAEERQFIETTLDTLPDIFYVISPEGEFLRWNDELPAVTGYTNTEIEQMNVLDFFEGEDIGHVQAFIEEVVETETAKIEADLITKDGAAIPYASHAHRLTDPEGDLVGICGISRDISEQKEHKQALQSTKERFQSIFETSNDAILVFDPDQDTIRMANPRASELLGYSHNELVSAIGPSDIHPHNLDEFHTLVADVIEKDRGRRELTCKHQTNKYVPTEVSAAQIEFNDRPHILASLRDISERKDRERTIKTLHEATKDLQTTETVEEVFETAVEAAQKVLDMPMTICWQRDDQKEILKPIAGTQSAFDQDPISLTPDDPEWELFEQGNTIPYKVADVRPGLPLEKSLLFPIKDKAMIGAGDPDVHAYEEYLIEAGRILVSHIEAALNRLEWTTRIKQRNQELETLHERTDFTLEVTDSIVWAVDPDASDVTMIRGPIGSVFGVESGEPSQKDKTKGLTQAEAQSLFENVFHPDDRPTVKQVYEAVQRGERDTFTIEFRTNPDSGEIRWLKADAYLKTNDDSRRLVGLTTDITDLKRREQELQRQNERLSEFASVISHDLRNPVSLARGQLQVARDDSDSDQLDKVEQTLNHMDDLIDNVRKLAQRGQVISDPESTDLDHVATNAWLLLGEEPDDLIIENDLGTITADEDRLWDLFKNLFENSLEHGGDDVTVRVGRLDDRQGFYVEDDGPGIPETDIDNIFESGYSSADDGMGFGLTIVRQIVDAHGWEIAVANGKNDGARFEITTSVQ